MEDKSKRNRWSTTRTKRNLSRTRRGIIQEENRNRRGIEGTPGNGGTARQGG